MGSGNQGPELVTPPLLPEGNKQREGRRSRTPWFVVLLLVLVSAVIAVITRVPFGGAGNLGTEADRAAATTPAPIIAEPVVAQERAEPVPPPEPVTADLIIEKAPPREPSAVERAYDGAMTRALLALERGDFGDARRALGEARKAIPDRPETADVGERLLADQRRREIQTLSQQAATHEASDRWSEARVDYQKILKLDADIRVGQTGFARSEEIAELITELRFHADNPDRLTTPAVRAEAERAVDRAGTISRSPTLTGLVAEVETAIDQWNTPISLVLRSDGKTEIQVTGVGRLGVLEQQSLQLPPGTYTVLGSRSGYRDVRINLTLAPGKTPPPLTVACEEKL